MIINILKNIAEIVLPGFIAVAILELIWRLAGKYYHWKHGGKTETE